VSSRVAGFEADGLDEFTAAFERRFGRVPELAARAPGRVNLIGEHTDYSEGLVLPCAIDRDTLALAAPRRDGQVRVWAHDLAEEGGFDPGAPRRRGGWIDYVQGVTFALVEAGHPALGLDLAVTSRVPRESGLSSSAALGLAVIGVFDAAARLGLDAAARASLVHRGESHFVGVGCGIMDQFASALGRRDHALRIDCRSREVRPVAMGADAPAILLVHSGVERALAGGAYRERVAECQAAFEAARGAGLVAAGARTLRDLSLERLPGLAGVAPERLFRRARHVVGENARVDDFCAALAAGDWEALATIMAASQRSLRDDYEVSICELDTLCELAAGVSGVIGSRLTGAGFGGCTLHLVDASRVGDAAETIRDGFESRFGRRPPAWVVRAWDGASRLPLDRGGSEGGR
jgi:galactokinase